MSAPVSSPGSSSGSTSPPWNGSAAQACEVAAVLHARGLHPGLVRQVAAVARTAGLSRLVGLGSAVLRDEVAGDVLAERLAVAAAAGRGPAHERSVARWLDAVATAQQAMFARPAVPALPTVSAGGGEGCGS